MPVHFRWLVAALTLAAGYCLLLPAQQRGRESRRGPQSEIFHTTVPDHPFDVILARPTDRSITVSLLAYREMSGYLEYGTRSAGLSRKSPEFQLQSGEPAQIVLDSLAPGTRYYYRLRHRVPGAAEFSASEEWTFRTQSARGTAFAFAVQADSHLDENASPEVYRLTLANMLDGKPDFLVDLGDTFMTDKRRSDFKQALPQYLAQRYFFGLVSHSAPLFLTLGNHDGEGGSRTDMAEWSLGQRRRYFPNPRPDAFYTGNREPLENYFAWHWGDALFVVLDPYWPTTTRPREDNWNWTLGTAQYRWLEQTLASSKAAFKFVFIHHPVGGKEQPIRGGVEAAKYNEWGGRNPDGSDGFPSHRPGWELPVHQLLAKLKVSVVFHGHDHMFAKEELDGVIYQLVPQPGAKRTGDPRNAREYGYVHGDVLGGAGYVRVQVAPDKATVDYVVSLTAGEATGSRKNNSVAHTYTVLSGAAR